VPGFLHATRLELRAVELDVHLSRDRQLVVIHDGTVDRTTTASGPVGDFTAAELAGLDARAEHPGWPEPVGVPTLDQVLDVLDDMPTIQIEIKRDTDERMEEVALAVLDAIATRGIGPRSVVSSFEPLPLEVIARSAPGQARAFIGAYDTPEFLATAISLGCTQADISLAKGSAEAVGLAHDAGMRVVGYQCNSPAALAQCLAWQVDAATSDAPSAILPLLAGSLSGTPGGSER
jgi:glycerophosphoryl diester phosphodiesterase